MVDEASAPSTFVLELECLQCDSGLSLCLDGATEILIAGSKIQTTLLTGDSWQEAATALYGIEAKVVESQPDRDDVRGRHCPLDFSMLISVIEASSGKFEICADVPIAGKSFNLRLTGTVRCIPWSGIGWKTVHVDTVSKYGRGGKADAHIAAGPRTWRVSLEARSVKLKTSSATVFAAYSYGPLRGQSGASRTFRTHPPVLARHNITTHLPKGFAAYSFSATKEAFEAAFEESLHIELWTRDAFRKDSLLAVAEVSLASAFSQPLRRSARLPSMVHGFRMFDQVCLLGSAEEKLPDIVGEIRILFFVEDLGPASLPVPSDGPAASIGKLPDMPVNSVSGHGPSDRSRSKQEVAVSLARFGLQDDPDVLAALAAEGLEALRSSPAYGVAFSLELWKQQEEERAKLRLRECETHLREQLEEEYRQRELVRVQTFRQRQVELRELEQRAKKKLAEIQQREMSVNSELSNSAVLREQAKRKADLAIQSCEEALRRQRAETAQALDFEERKHSALESKLKELELEASEARKKCSELQATLASKEATDSSATLSAEHELRGLQLKLCEEKVRCETLAASRDHFRRKVEELCQRILHQQVPEAVREEVIPASELQLPAPAPVLQAVEGNSSAHPQSKPSPDFSLEWLQQQKSELLATGLYTDDDAVIRALNAQMEELQGKRANWA